MPSPVCHSKFSRVENEAMKIEHKSTKVFTVFLHTTYITFRVPFQLSVVVFNMAVSQAKPKPLQISTRKSPNLVLQTI